MINPKVEFALQTYIQRYLMHKGTCTIKDLLCNYNASTPTTEKELRRVIDTALKVGNIQVVYKKNPRDNSTITLVRSFLEEQTNESVSIVISRPKLRELSVRRVEIRNNQMDSVDCFRKIITSAKNTLRICSPFLEKNILDPDAFPDLKKLLSEALTQNVKIKILSRELNRRGAELRWIIDIARELNKEHNLVIADYYLSTKNGRILSSTHAKLIIADYHSAYVGSAELRRNSLVANFEVGCLITGLPVVGICESFDLMFSYGTPLQ